MANLFEKPRAATPMSTFSRLPLEFLERAMDRKTKAYYAARAEVEAQEDSLLNLKYLSGDAQRHHEIQAEYDRQLDSIVDSANGDYGNIQGALDHFSRRLKAEIAHGELGAQQNAYLAAMKMKETEDKKLSDGKISEEGYRMFMDSIGAHQTKDLQDGTFSTFNGYVASTIVDPVKFLQDSADEIVAKYDEEGMKHVTPDLIRQNLYNSMSGNSNLVKALRERVYGKGVKFDDYLGSVVSGVISDKQFYEHAKVTGSNGQAKGTTQGFVMQDVQQPGRVNGTLNYTGGSVPLLRDLGALFGADSWGEHRAIVEKPEMQKRIKYIEQKTGTKFPDTPSAQSEWLQNNFAKDRKGEVSVRGASASEQKAMTNKGQLANPNAAVYDRTGRLLDKDEIKAIQGSSKDQNDQNKFSFISGVVNAGGMYPPGTMVVTSHNGEQYFVEPSDPKLINSENYNNKLIDMASNTNTGYVSGVTLRSNVDGIPMGTYDVEHVPTSGSYDNYNLYQNGKLVYRKFVSNGRTYGVAVDNEE